MKDHLTELFYEITVEARLQQRSQVLKRNLPRPLVVNRQLFKETYSATENQSLEEVAAELIRREMVAVMAHDNVNYPIQDKQFKPPSQVCRSRDGVS